MNASTTKKRLEAIERAAAALAGEEDLSGAKAAETRRILGLIPEPDQAAFCSAYLRQARKEPMLDGDREILNKHHKVIIALAEAALARMQARAAR